MTDSTDTSISVVVPMHNSENTIERCLEPLSALREAGRIEEIIVVDDGSTDETPNLAQRFPVRLISTPAQAGPAAARNYAARIARSSILWFVDSDVVVQVNGIDVVADAFADPNVAAVFGAYDTNPPAANFLSQYKNLVHRYYHQAGKRQASTFWAGCGAVRADVFSDLGGFDEEGFPYPSIEDIELGRRIIEAGWIILLLPGLEGTHLKRWRFRNLVHTEIFRRALPWSRLMLSRGGLVDDLNVGRSERLRALLAIVTAATLVAAPFSWWSRVGALVMATILVGANYRLIVYFWKHRGPWFAFRALLFHQFYYLYSAATFAYAWLERAWRKVNG